MKFLDKNILLNSRLARKLYFSYAKNLPIIDYHCHINPSEIVNNKSFENITQLWLYGDHYKWRLMRNCGVLEKYITGDAKDFEKFEKFCQCMPSFIGNPIYIWCHLELLQYFNLNIEICGKNAKEIFERTKEMLKSPDFYAKSIIKRSNVQLICTTDDPIDSLDEHKKLKKEENGFDVLPTFRPDKALNIESYDFKIYIKKLAETTKINIDGLESLKNALVSRLEFFVKCGCKISDHALSGFLFEKCTEKDADIILKKSLNGETLSAVEIEKYKTHLLLFLAQKYFEKNIVMQLHFSCIRNNNSSMFKKLGADTGFDAINRSGKPHKLAAFLDSLSSANKLPKTIVYSLDENDNAVINTIIGCFQGLGRGYLQHGSAWWFNDTELGMTKQLTALSQYGVLANFVGMLTDSRSFTSYVRHDYFRRILCSVIAKQVDEGKYPKNLTNLKELVENICYYNIKNYLK